MGELRGRRRGVGGLSVPGAMWKAAGRAWWSPRDAVAIAVALLTASACASVGSGYDGGGGGYGRRDGRQFIGSYSDVRDVGVSRRYVYTATPSGIGIYDRLSNAWLPPLARENGVADDPVTVLAGDPVEDALWYGVPGAVVVYRPQTEQLQRTQLTGVPDIIAFDRSNNGDALVRAGGQWTRVSRVGITTPMMQPPAPSSLYVPSTLQDVYERFPVLRSGSSLLLRDQQADRQLRGYPVISGGISPERASEVWLGTGGDGLYRVDPTFQQATGLRFGPIESGIGALALAADGVWAAGLGQSPLRGGLSFASNDLQRWRWIDGTIRVPMIGVRAHAMSLRAGRAWIATDRGVVLARVDGSDELTAWTSLDGLPDDLVYAIAARPGGAWAGTARGLVWLSDSAGARNTRSRGIGVRVLDNTAVYALQLIGDTLWAGTSAGLVAIPSQTGALLRPTGADPALRRPIRALAWNDTLLLAATDDALLAIAPRGGRESVRISAVDPRDVGEITRLAIDDRSIVMSGSHGVVVLPRAGGGARILRVPGDIPAPALDVVMSHDWLWVATPAGLARFRRASDGGLP
jgi:hypothetical protein